MKLGIVIQARMGSTRLPGKILKKIGNRNLLEHILYRLSKLRYKVKICIATSDLEKDNIVKDFCVKKNICCFRGSELNVLKRYYMCAKKECFTHIVRLTGDNPFTDTEELDNLIKLHLEKNADYSRSFASLPKGVGSEIFSFKALEISYKYGEKENHKEHVNEYIEENKDKFKISELEVMEEKNRPEISLTVDTPDDYKKACFIVENSASEYITTQEAVKLCSQYV